jgi:hypothetical protein
MGQVTGIIEAVSTKYSGKVGIKVGGTFYSTKQEWYSDWGVPFPAEGDEVSFGDGGKNYIQKLKMIKQSGNPSPFGDGSKPVQRSSGSSPARTASVSDDARQSAIIRQNALTNAVNYTVGTNAENSPEDVVELAKVFYAYTSGAE